MWVLVLLPSSLPSDSADDGNSIHLLGSPSKPSSIYAHHFFSHLVPKEWSYLRSIPHLCSSHPIPSPLGLHFSTLFPISFHQHFNTLPSFKNENLFKLSSLSTYFLSPPPCNQIIFKKSCLHSHFPLPMQSKYLTITAKSVSQHS